MSKKFYNHPSCSCFSPEFIQKINLGGPWPAKEVNSCMGRVKSAAGTYLQGAKWNLAGKHW